ncbi:MAG: SDR family oxidoreductase [Streptosporangiales bacterium]|nr:SDR family oxidoreductase [Streptosporangiales bacterium]
MAGRAVLVTGGSRGIGRAVAEAFAERGDRVAVHYRSNPDLAEEVRGALPGDGHVVVRADIADPDAVRRMVDEAAEGLGGLDVLVNNAGMHVDHPIESTDYDAWQAAWSTIIGTNLLGAANVTWCAVRHLRQRPGARIVNVSSRGAFRGEPVSPAYGASKAALNSFGQSIAQALAPLDIVVSAVAPGFVETDLGMGGLDAEKAAGRRAQSPFGRVAYPAEIAAAVVWLASPEAQWASGAILDLNGASYLRT